MYHNLFRRVRQVLKARHPNIEPEIVPRYAIKGNNDTKGPNALVPSYLVSGTMPTFSVKTINTPTQVGHMDVMRTAGGRK